GYLGFAPALKAENFKAPFVTAEGWGTYQQQRIGKEMKVSLKIYYGKLRLNQFSIAIKEIPNKIHLLIDDKNVSLQHEYKEGKCILNLTETIILETNTNFNLNLIHDS
ncbi:MAG: hypothetical protein ACO29O_08705, partial [Chitinophagaceae bacterium]